MSYFQTRSELADMRQLLRLFDLIRAIEQDNRERMREEGRNYLTPLHMFREIREESTRTNPEYQQLRDSYSKLIPRANEICEREVVSWHRQGRSAPLEGALPFSNSIFWFALDRPSDILDIDNDLRDTANQAIGVLERRERQESLQLMNPINWLKRVIVFLIRLPYTLIEQSGFDVDKVQEHLIARLFHLAYVIALIIVLVRFGLSDQVGIWDFLGNLLSP